MLEGAARQVTVADFEDYDLLLAMDRENLARHARDRARRRGRGEGAAAAHYDPASPARPTSTSPTPYYGGPHGFETVLDQVEAACRGLLDDLRRR